MEKLAQESLRFLTLYKNYLMDIIQRSKPKPLPQAVTHLQQKSSKQIHLLQYNTMVTCRRLRTIRNSTRLYHEEMTMNEKYKPSYTSRINCFLFMATNRPVKITDAKSGIIRRLIDVKPSGRKLPAKRYQTLMTQIEFELGALATYCLNVYHEMGKNYYSGYRPLEMMLQTDVFFNYIEANYHVFKTQDGISMSQAYEIYKVYCDEALIEYKLPRHRFREELKNYFEKFYDVTRIDNKQVRSYYSGFIADKFTNDVVIKPEHPNSIVLDCEESIFDEVYGYSPAQYASTNEIPTKKMGRSKKPP